jgi:PAS domain S-box-containing protein
MVQLASQTATTVLAGASMLRTTADVGAYHPFTQSMEVPPTASRPITPVLPLPDKLAQQAEERYRTLFNALDEGICLFELLYDERGAAVDYRFVEVNPAFERQMGLTDAPGKLGSEVAPGTESYWLDAYAHVVETGEPVRFENYHQGTGRWYELYASRAGGEGSRQGCTVFTDITARKQDAQRQQFLLQLSDVLRPLADPLAIQQAALQFVATQLHLDRLLYNEINPDVTTYTVRASYVREGFLTYGGVQPMGPFTESVRALQQGLTKVVYDVETDASFSAEEKAICADIQVRAFVTVPLIKNGRWVLNLVAHSSQPRPWPPHELHMLEETAERTWAAVERAQAEAALHASEARLQLALSAAELGTFVWYVAEDRTEADARALTHFGFPPDAAATLSESLARIIHPEDVPQYVAAVAHAIDPAGPGTLHQEFRIRRPDGERWMSVSAHTVFEGNPPEATRLTGVLADITARKRREATLALLAVLAEDFAHLATEEALMQRIGERLAQHLQLDGLTFADVDEGRESVTVKYTWNAADVPLITGTFRFAEYMTEEFADTMRAGNTWVVGNTQADARTDAAATAAIHVGAIVNVPYHRRGDWQGCLTAMSRGARAWTPDEVALIQEVATRTFPRLERARAEAALAESEARLRGLLDNLPGGAAFIIGPDLRYQLAAGEALALTGHTPADFVGRPLADVLAPEVLAAYRAHLQQALAGASFVHEHLTHGRAFVSRGAPLRAPSGEVTAALVVSYDITDRRHAEAALQHAEEQFRTVANLVPDLLWRTESNSNTTWYNQRWLDYTGQTLAEAAGDGWAEAIHPDDRERSAQQYQVAMQTGHPLQQEHRLRSAGGEYRWFTATALPARDAQGTITHWFGAATDIEAQKQAEAGLATQVADRTRELRESRDLLQSVFDTSLILLVVYHTVRNAQGAIEDFRIALVNQEAARETGRADLVGKTMKQEFPGMPAGLFNLMCRTVDSDEPQRGEVYYPGAGVDKWYACMFVKLEDWLVGTYLDITARKRAEQEQLRSFTLLQQAEAVAGLGSWSYELATGHLHFSEGMYQLLGLPPGSVVAPSIYAELIVAEDRERAQQFGQQFTAGLADGETTLRLRVGEQVKTVRLQTLVLRAAAGEAERILGVGLDISQVRRLEADNLQLRLAQQQALFEAVLEAQEAERARIAENLHNGLGQTLYATKLQLNQLLTGPSTSALARADQLLAEAIRQTRTLSHELVPTALTEFGLVPALTDICRSLSSPQLRVHCTVELDTAPPLPLLLQVALYRIAQELLQNVVKHARATHASLAVEVVPDFVLLRVEDNGVGFTQAPAAPTGFGLRSIRSRVALLNGQLELGSSPAYGTYVRLRIPLLPPSLPAAA